MVNLPMDGLKSRFKGKVESLVIAIFILSYVPLIVWLAIFLGYSREAPFIGNLDPNLQLLCAGLFIIVLVIGILRPFMKMVLYIKN